MADENNDAKLLELAPVQLAIPFKVSLAGHSYRVRHFLRPPAPADWFAYEAALRMAVEELPPESDSDAPDSGAPDSGEPGYRLEVRSTDAALELWHRLIRRVEGYRFASEPVTLSASAEGYSFPPTSGHGSCPEQSRRISRAESPATNEGASAPEGDWRSLIPLAHKEAAVRALTLVAPAPATLPGSANGHFPLLADEVPVVLEAALAGRAYPHLLHRFRPPSVADERIYRRLLAESLIVRGSRTPRTLIPARLPALVRLYDRLILSVAGYSLNGCPLSTPEDIARAMDAWHKRVAVQTLFGDFPAGVPAEEDAPTVSVESAE